MLIKKEENKMQTQISVYIRIDQAQKLEEEKNKSEVVRQALDLYFKNNKEENKMFENIKKEQTMYDWRTLKELKEEEPGSYKWYKEKLQELKEVNENLNGPDPDNLVDRQRKLIENIKAWRAAEIVWLAYENTGGTFSGHVFIAPETGELHDTTWTGNTRINPELNWIELYSLDSNWVNNNPFQVEDIIPEEGYEMLEEKYGDEANFLDREQLESIDYDLDTCLLDYLRWTIEN
jgi:hypothetical protein